MDKILNPKVSVSRTVSRDKASGRYADRARSRPDTDRSIRSEAAATSSEPAELALAGKVGAPFASILFINPPEAIDSAGVPACFRDLNLDQVIDAITLGREDYNLRPYFHISLTSLDEITYRHEIMQDLEDQGFYRDIKAFGESMRAMRKHVATAIKMRYQYQKEGWFLNAVDTYCSAIVTLDKNIVRSCIRSHGLLAFRDYVGNYVRSTEFKSLQETAHRLKDSLAAVRYNVLINGGGLKVRRYDMEADYSAKIEETFAKFRQGSVKDYASKLLDGPEMNHVEAKILDFVAILYRDVFSRLNAFFEQQNGKFVDAKIGKFDREIQFYLAYREYIGPLQDRRLKFCYPQMSDRGKAVNASGGFEPL
jgi:DNA mismatch repair protein MutS